MKKGISDAGFKRIAQMFEQEEVDPMEDLLERTFEQLRLADILAGEEDVVEAINILNNTPNGERALWGHLTDVWGLEPENASKVLDIISEAAHEALDYM